MGSINEEKYRNVILYLCSQLGGEIRGRKKLAKLLYFVDFDKFEYNESMESVAGHSYARLPMGPVPDKHKSVVARVVEEGLLETVQGCEFQGQARPTEVYRALAAPERSVFSDDEMFVLERVARKHLPLNGAAPEELSHREAPWGRRRSVRPDPVRVGVLSGNRLLG